MHFPDNAIFFLYKKITKNKFVHIFVTQFSYYEYTKVTFHGYTNIIKTKHYFLLLIIFFIALPLGQGPPVKTVYPHFFI